MCRINCRDTSAPREMPSSTSTVWVITGGNDNCRPASAAPPTAIMAPEINPPGNPAQRNRSPPAVPIASVSSTRTVSARPGRAGIIGAGISDTQPYGKSAPERQMR